MRYFKTYIKYLFKALFIFLLFFVVIYPKFSFPSYYGSLTKEPQLNGIDWLTVQYPEDKELVDYINNNIKGQPVILEAQGDSYTDYERISAYTGNPTVAGWFVHEWLWRGSADVVGKRAPDITTIYETSDIQQTLDLLKKYHVKYVVIGRQERTKYTHINEEKFSTIGSKIFESSNRFGALYQLK